MVHTRTGIWRLLSNHLVLWHERSMMKAKDDIAPLSPKDIRNPPFIVYTTYAQKIKTSREVSSSFV